MKIAIGCDHAGFSHKDPIINFLIQKGHEPLDFGTFSNDSVDFPDFAHAVAQAVEQNRAHIGIVLCGSGQGVSMTVNKHAGIRGALCWLPEIARLAREHNDANVLALPARFVSKNAAIDIIEIFLETKFEGGRHAGRVAKIAC